MGTIPAIWMQPGGSLTGAAHRSWRGRAAGLGRKRLGAACKAHRVDYVSLLEHMLSKPVRVSCERIPPPKKAVHEVEQRRRGTSPGKSRTSKLNRRGRSSTKAKAKRDPKKRIKKRPPKRTDRPLSGWVRKLKQRPHLPRGGFRATVECGCVKRYATAAGRGGQEKAEQRAAQQLLLCLLKLSPSNSEEIRDKHMLENSTNAKIREAKKRLRWNSKAFKADLPQDLADVWHDNRPLQNAFFLARVASEPSAREEDLQRWKPSASQKGKQPMLLLTTFLRTFTTCL